jgi:hypothetical protein
MRSSRRKIVKKNTEHFGAHLTRYCFKSHAASEGKGQSKKSASSFASRNFTSADIGHDPMAEF